MQKDLVLSLYTRGFWAVLRVEFCHNERGLRRSRHLPISGVKYQYILLLSARVTFRIRNLTNR